MQEIQKITCSDPKTAQAIAAEIEHLGAIRAISLDVAHNFRLFIERGFHEQFYQS